MLHPDNLHLFDDLMPEEVRERMRTRTRERITVQGELTPTKWYYPSGSGEPVACEWQGWVQLGISKQWVTVSLFSAS